MRQSAPVSSDLALAAASGCPTSRRFTEAGFARFTGTAPIPASSGEAGGRPIRHRLNRGGNRRLKAAIHRAAMIQLRCEPRAQQLRDNALQRGHTRREAMRILKRHLSNIIYRTMLRDLEHVTFT